jgi:hypothetical protein
MRGNAHPMSGWLLLFIIGASVPRLYQKDSQISGYQTFASPDGDSQFTYPGSYALYTGSVCGPEPAIACVVFPESRYTGTNFAGASFAEREIDEATTKSTCLTSPMRAVNVPEFDIATKDPKRIINRVSFLHGISVSVGSGTAVTTDVYRAFHKGKCYELSLDLATTQFAYYPPGTVKEFTDEDRVRHELTTILDSFRFLK